MPTRFSARECGRVLGARGSDVERNAQHRTVNHEGTRIESGNSQYAPTGETQIAPRPIRFASIAAIRVCCFPIRAIRGSSPQYILTQPAALLLCKNPEPMFFLFDILDECAMLRHEG